MKMVFSNSLLFLLLSVMNCLYLLLVFIVTDGYVGSSTGAHSFFVSLMKSIQIGNAAVAPFSLPPMGV